MQKFHSLLFVLTLIWVGVRETLLSPVWFSVNNSETVKAVILALSSIQ